MGDGRRWEGNTHHSCPGIYEQVLWQQRSPIRAYLHRLPSPMEQILRPSPPWEPATGAPLGKGVRVEQSSVFVTGVAVGHAGEVVGNCALET